MLAYLNLSVAVELVSIPSRLMSTSPRIRMPTNPNTAKVHTYVGKLLATHDSIAADEVLSVYGEIFRKKKTLEKEMTEKLFSFLPEPNTYVTQLQDTSHGLSVQFYLYTRPTYIRAQPLESEIEDHHELEYIALCLLNGSFVDNNSFNIMLNWVELKGIRMNDLQIRSTFACYEENVVTEKSTVILKWPYAKIGEIALPESIDSSKKGLSMIRTCTGDFRSGAEWGTPYGEYDKRDNSLTSRLKSLLNVRKFFYTSE
ncbi:uncharacterized protein LOC129216296 [Uloborus diversus]|uniref:uncharacterized protein LOC129216296 n=1 Tax=Uloborus diversus TaxID=327109 RepID=UPI0024094786|nr:uncharacterized protein LOC129216296 [Uloborus diversus]